MIYRHYKGGEYDFIGVALVEATLAPVVVYRSTEDGTIWTRPAAEFFGKVQCPPTGDGVMTLIPRFTPVSANGAGGEH
jgi:hypothetical protein